MKKPIPNSNFHKKSALGMNSLKGPTNLLYRTRESKMTLLYVGIYIGIILICFVCLLLSLN